jgi:hypothetical protein
MSADPTKQIAIEAFRALDPWPYVQLAAAVFILLIGGVVAILAVRTAKRSPAAERPIEYPWITQHLVQIELDHQRAQEAMIEVAKLPAELSKLSEEIRKLAEIVDSKLMRRRTKRRRKPQA